MARETATLPKAPTSLWRPIQADPSKYFSKEEIEKSRSYLRPARRVGRISRLLSFLIALAYIHFQFPHKVVSWLGFDSWQLQLLSVIFVLTLVDGILSLPFDIWREFGHEKKWGFSTQTPGRFASDQLKGLLLGAVFVSLLVLPLWWLIRSTEFWWAWSTLLFLAFALLIGTLFPIVIMPLFNKFTPLENESLKAKLLAIADKAGVKISEFRVMDASKRTKKDNAFFAGMGKTRRVVVYDNLLQQPEDCIEVVVAHEIGHWRRRHVLRGVLQTIITTPLTMFLIKYLAERPALLEWAGVESIGDPRAAPLFMLVSGFVFTVIGFVSAWFSRYHERQADLDALELTGNPDAYKDLWRNFTERNLPDLDPSLYYRLKGSHPPIAERIAFAELWSRSRK